MFKLNTFLFFQLFCYIFFYVKILVNNQKGRCIPMTKEQKEMFSLLTMSNYTLQQKDYNAFIAQRLFEVIAKADTELDEQVRPVAQVVICPLTQ